MSWHKGGFTERMANIMLCGSVLATDATTYLQRDYTKEDMIVFFDVKHPETLVEKIKKYTQNEEEAKKIAAAGMEKSKIYAAVGNWGTYINDIIAGAKQEEKKYAAECLDITV